MIFVHGEDDIRIHVENQLVDEVNCVLFLDDRIYCLLVLSDHETSYVYQQGRSELPAIYAAICTSFSNVVSSSPELAHFVVEVKLFVRDGISICIFSLRFAVLVLILWHRDGNVLGSRHVFVVQFPHPNVFRHDMSQPTPVFFRGGVFFTCHMWFMR